MPSEKRTASDVSVDIDGVTYTVGKATGKVVKKIIQLGADVEGADLTDRALTKAVENEAPDAEILKLQKRSREQGETSISVIYKQAALLLRSPDAKHPDPDKLEDELEIGDARLLLGKIRGEDADPNDAAS